MSYVDFIRESIRGKLDESEQLVNDTIAVAPSRIRQAVHAVVDAYGHGAGKLIPDYVVDLIADAIIAAALESLNSCLDRIAVMREANEYLGSPDTLREMAEVFGAIGADASNMQINKDDLEGYMTWDAGRPSKEYENAIEAQITALAGIEPKMSGVKGVLRTHADDIENYYLELLALVGGAVMAIGGLVAAILSLVGAALSAVPTAGAGAVVGIIAAALSLVLAVVGLVVSGIAAVQLLVAANQGAANKLDALQIGTLVWEKPAFAQIQ